MSFFEATVVFLETPSFVSLLAFCETFCQSIKTKERDEFPEYLRQGTNTDRSVSFWSALTEVTNQVLRPKQELTSDVALVAVMRDIDGTVLRDHDLASELHSNLQKLRLVVFNGYDGYDDNNRTIDALLKMAREVLSSRAVAFVISDAHLDNPWLLAILLLTISSDKSAPVYGSKLNVIEYMTGVFKKQLFPFPSETFYYLRDKKKPLWLSAREIAYSMERLLPIAVRSVIDAPELFVARPVVEQVVSLVRQKGGHERSIVILESGDGVPRGTGKTSAAKKIASNLREDYVGPHVLLELNGAERGMAAASDENVRMWKRTVLQNCHVPVNEESDIELMFEQLTMSTTGVLVLDDAAPGDVELLLPDTQSAWLIIVTAQPSLGAMGALGRFKVGIMSVEEGIELLSVFAYVSRRNRAQDDKSLLAKLVVDVCGAVPMVIVDMGKLLHKVSYMSLADILAKLKNDGLGGNHAQLLEKVFRNLTDGAQKLLRKLASSEVWPPAAPEPEPTDELGAFDGSPSPINELLNSSWLSIDGEYRVIMNTAVRRFLLFSTKKRGFDSVESIIKFL